MAPKSYRLRCVLLDTTPDGREAYIDRTTETTLGSSLYGTTFDDLGQAQRAARERTAELQTLPELAPWARHLIIVEDALVAMRRRRFIGIGHDLAADAARLVQEREMLPIGEPISDDLRSRWTEAANEVRQSIVAYLDLI